MLLQLRPFSSSCFSSTFCWPRRRRRRRWTRPAYHVFVSSAASGSKALGNASAGLRISPRGQRPPTYPNSGVAICAVRAPPFLVGFEAKSSPILLVPRSRASEVRMSPVARLVLLVLATASGLRIPAAQHLGRRAAVAAALGATTLPLRPAYADDKKKQTKEFEAW